MTSARGRGKEAVEEDSNIAGVEGKVWTGIGWRVDKLWRKTNALKKES